MSLPLPTLDLPATGTLDQGSVQLNQLKGNLSLSIPNTANVLLNGRVSAFICETQVDIEEPAWSGDRDYSISAGDYVVPPGKEPDEGHFNRVLNLQVKIPKKALEPFAGKTVYVGYSSIGESGVPNNSPLIALAVH